MHVIATLDRAGAEGTLARLCLRLNRAEFEPSVCCLTRGGGYESELRAALGSQTEGAAGVPVTVLGKKGRYDVAMLWRLRALMRRDRPDIVHTWLFTANTWGRIAAWLARRGGLADVPVIIASERAVDRWKNPFHRLADRRLAAASAAIVANCEAVKRFCVEDVGIPSKRVRVILNGMNLRSFDSAFSHAIRDVIADANCGADRIRMGTVARLEPQKGIPFLIEAMELLQSSGVDAELWIVGDGPDRPELEAMVNASPGLRDSVKFLGRRDDVPGILSQLDIFVLPSLWEGLPNAVMEAMAARLPVVATNVDGTPELVNDGETGLLVPPKSAEALADAIAKLVADGALRQRMGQAGRRRIEQHFTEDRMIAETEALYRELIERV